MALASAKRPAGRLAAQLDTFLCAELRSEPNGMSLSVISALARLNVDPYREAVRLAELPRLRAALSLQTMLKRLGADAVDAGRVASVIKLLPSMDAEPVHPRSAAARAPRSRVRRWQLWAIVSLSLACLSILAMRQATAEDPPAAVGEQP